MWPDRVSNPGPLALESDALPTAAQPNHCDSKIFSIFRSVGHLVQWHGTVLALLVQDHEGNISMKQF